MKSIFKRVAVLVIAVCAMSVAANAQDKGDMAAGANVVLGTGDSFTNYGLGAKFQYNVTAPIRLEGAFTYFFKKDYNTMWDLSLNAHYLFAVGETVRVYPLAGVGVLNYGVDLDLGLGEYGVDDSASKTDVAFNLGGGIDFDLTDRLVLNAELKYKISDRWNRFLVSAGIAYMF